MSSTPYHNLQDQKALVTGATSGLGRAIAFQLARDGAEVIVHGRDIARGAETVDAITDAGGRARFVAADLSNPIDLRLLVEDIGAQARRRLGHRLRQCPQSRRALLVSAERDQGHGGAMVGRMRAAALTPSLGESLCRVRILPGEFHATRVGLGVGLGRWRRHPLDPAWRDRGQDHGFGIPGGGGAGEQ